MRTAKRIFIALTILLDGFFVRFYFKNVGFIEEKEFLPFAKNLRNIRYLQIIAIFLILWLLLRFLLARSRKTSADSASFEAVLPFTPFILLVFVFMGYWLNIDYTVYRLIMSFAIGISLSWMLTLFYRGKAKPMPVGICWGILIAIMLLYVVVYSYHNIIDYNLGKAHAIDFGRRVNMLWNTVHGRFLYSELHKGCFLKLHFSPILAVLSPIYLTPLGTYLSIIITKILAIGVAVPLFLLAKEKIKSNFLALCLSISILLVRHYQTGIFSDLYAVHFEPIIIVFIFYFIEKKNWIAYGIFSALLLTCMEDKFLALALIGFYVAVFRNKRIVGWTTVAAAIVLGVIILQLIMPTFREGRSTAGMYVMRYRWLGETPLDIAKTVLTRQGYFFRHLFNADRTIVLLSLFVPFLFLSFCSGGIIVVMLPTLVGHLLSDVTIQRHLWGHYSLTVIPFIAVTSIYGASNILEKKIELPPVKRLLSKLASGKVAFFIACYLLITGLTLSLLSKHAFIRLAFQIPRSSETEYSEFLWRIRGEIPSTSRIYASDTIYSYFAERKPMHPLVANERQIKEMLEAAKNDIGMGVYVLIDVACRHYGAEPSRGLLGLLMSRKFAVYDYYSDRMIVLRANHYPGRNEDFINYYWKHLEAEEMMSTPRCGDDVIDEDASNGKARFVSRSAEKNRHIVFGPYHVYPAGEYTATFYLKVKNTTPGEIALIDIADAWASKTDMMVILDSRKIDSSQFPDEAEYSPFTLSFSIKENTSLDLRVMFLGNADLYIDRIEVDSPIFNF